MAHSSKEKNRYISTQANFSYDTINNVIAEDSFFKGKVSLNGDMLIEGTYEGEGEKLNVGLLIIKETGRVKCNVEAQIVIVEGILIGNVRASVRVLLTAGAKVVGHIISAECIVQYGALFDGKFTIVNDSHAISKKNAISKYVESLYPKQNNDN